MKINDDERGLDAELRMLRNCLEIIQGSGHQEKIKSEKVGFARTHIDFIEKHICEYPEQSRGEFRREFKSLKELFNILLSFFVNTNKKS